MYSYDVIKDAFFFESKGIILQKLNKNHKTDHLDNYIISQAQNLKLYIRVSYKSNLEEMSISINQNQIE